MSQRKHKPEEIVAKLRQVDVLVSQGRSTSEAVRAISVTPVTYYRWRKDFGGLQRGRPPRRAVAVSEGGVPTEATVARALVSRYADHLPLYRQSQIL